MTQQVEMFPEEPVHTAPNHASAGSVEIIPQSEDTMHAALADDLESAARRVRKRLKNMSTEIIEIGRELSTVKQRLEHGGFLEWVEKACRLPPRTAQLMMRAAEWAEGRHEIVAHLEPTAIYLLAAPSTPETVRHAVLSQLERGQKLRPTAVKDMIRAAKEHKQTPREKNDRRKGSDQHDGRPAHPQPEFEQSELQELRDWGPVGHAQAAVTNELIEMLLAWERFDEFLALLKKADISSLAQALKDRSDRLNTGAVNKSTATNPAQTLLMSPEAAADKPAEGEPAPLALQRAAGEVPEDYVEVAPEATRLASPQPSGGVSAEELITMWSLLKPTTQWYGRQGVAEGTNHPHEHHQITKALVQFRSAASNASPAERQRFLEMTAPQLAGHVEEAA